jgi:hypothetical protein
MDPKKSGCFNSIEQGLEFRKRNPGLIASLI